MWTSQHHTRNAWSDLNQNIFFTAENFIAYPMASAPPPSSDVDPRSGFSSTNGVYYSLRAPPPLPPDSLPLSIASYALSLLPSPPPSNPAIIFSTTSSSSASSISFPLLLSQVSSLASALRSHLRISKGDVIFILAPTSLEIPILYIALLSIGAVVSPSNPISTPEEIAHQVSLTNPSVAFTNAPFAAKLPSHLTTVLLESPLFRSFLEPGAPAPSPPVETSQYDPAAILYSSGTTGLVKGVIITHRNLIAVIARHYATREARPLEDGPNLSLFTMPLFHVYGFFMLLRYVALGDTTVLMEKVDLEAILCAVHAHRVKFIHVHSALVLALAKSDLVSKFDLSSLRRVVSGGAPLGRELVELFMSRFPTVKIFQGYGLTESTGAAGQLGPEEWLVFGSVGKISAGLEAKIVDPATGEVLPPGRQGELWLRGPTIMKGYIGDDEATASTLDSEGWLKTGDLCYFDQDGFLFIVDRLKELIKYKAYQVPPAELEKILLSHPEIADAAVIPYPDEEAGQVPMAFVVRQPQSTLSEKQIIDFVAKQVSPYKKIRRVAFISSIPKSAAGKILRRELVNCALSPAQGQNYETVV